jgi:hypothetical protein
MGAVEAGVHIADYMRRSIRIRCLYRWGLCCKLFYLLELVFCAEQKG